MDQRKLGQTNGDTEVEPDRVEDDDTSDEADVDHADDEDHEIGDREDEANGKDGSEGNSEDGSKGDGEDGSESNVEDATRDGDRNAADDDALRTDECLSIRVRDIELPDDAEDRTAILDRLREVVEETLVDEYGIECRATTGRLGHEYAQIPVVCPECDGPLDTNDTYTGDANEAYARAACENCSYTGGVTFRAIDLKSDDHEDTHHQSAVRIGKRTPTYVGYGG